MLGPLKIALAVVALAGVGGLLAGLAFGSEVPEPRIGDPVVITPAPTPSGSPPTPTGTPSSQKSDDVHDDDVDDEDGDDITEVPHSPRPWGDTDDDGPGEDRRGDDAADDDSDGDRSDDLGGDPGGDDREGGAVAGDDG